MRDGMLVPNSVLDDAYNLVHSDRYDDYGHPAVNLERTAKMWSAMLGIDIDGETVAALFIAAKLSRHMNERKRDNVVDIAGYAEAMWLCHEVQVRTA